MQQKNSTLFRNALKRKLSFTFLNKPDRDYRKNFAIFLNIQLCIKTFLPKLMASYLISFFSEKGSKNCLYCKLSHIFVLCGVFVLLPIKKEKQIKFIISNSFRKTFTDFKTRQQKKKQKGSKLLRLKRSSEKNNLRILKCFSIKRENFKILYFQNNLYFYYPDICQYRYINFVLQTTNKKCQLTIKIFLNTLYSFTYRNT